MPLERHEREVLREVLRFDALRRDPELNLPSILGVGIVASREGPRPLVLLDNTPVGDQLPFNVRSGEDLEQALAICRTALIALGFDPSSPEYPHDGEYLFVTRPEPLVSSGQAIRSVPPQQERGTVGLPVERVDVNGNTVEGFITAGHCAPAGVGSTIEAIHARGLLPAKHTTLGTVALHCEPISGGGADHDLAVVDNIPGAVAVTAPSTGAIASLSPVIRSPLALDVYGGVSGTVEAEIMASFLDVEYSSNRKWKTCWLLVPSGVTASGDSGAAALDLNKEVVGILAGGSRSTRKSRAPSFQYLQDMESLQQGFLSPNDVTLA